MHYLLASFKNHEEACKMLCGKGRVQTQDLGYQSGALWPLRYTPCNDMHYMFHEIIIWPITCHITPQITQQITWLLPDITWCQCPVIRAKEWPAWPAAISTSGLSRKCLCTPSQSSAIVSFSISFPQASAPSSLGTGLLPLK